MHLRSPKRPHQNGVRSEAAGVGRATLHGQNYSISAALRAMLADANLPLESLDQLTLGARETGRTGGAASRRPHVA